MLLLVLMSMAPIAFPEKSLYRTHNKAKIEVIKKYVQLVFVL